MSSFTDELVIAVIARDQGAGSVVRGVGQQFNTVGSQIDGAGQKAQSFFSRVASGAAAFITANVIGGVFREVKDQIGDTLGKAMDFEGEMSKIKAVSGATAEELGSLRQTALDLGMATDVGSVSASDAADAIFELGKAGVSVQAINEGLAKSTLQLAAAAGPEFGVANSAALAADSMNSFGLSAKDMPSVINNLVGAANASSIGLNELKYSLSAVGPVANQVGMSIDDFSTAIAEFGMHGLKGSDAGTSLKTMLLNLSPTSTRAKEAMMDLGLWTKEGGSIFYDASGKLKSFSDISQILQDHLAGLTQEQQAVALKTIFGTDAVRAASIIAQEGAAGAAQYAAAIDKQGDAAAAAATMSDNLAGRWEAFVGTIDTIKIAVGSKLLPSLSGITSGLNNLAGTALTALDSGNWQPFFDTLGGGLGDLLDKAGQMLPVISPVTDFIKNNFQATLFGVGTVIATVVVPALWSIAAPVIAATAPLLALGAAAAGVYWAIQNNFMGIGDIANNVMSGLQTFASFLTDAFNSTDEWPNIQEYFSGLPEPLRIAGQFAGDLAATLGALWDNITSGQPVMITLQGLASNLGFAFGGLVNDGLDALITKFPLLEGPVNTVKGLFSGLVDAIGAAAQGFQQGGIGGAIDALAAKFPIIQGPVDVFRTAFTNIRDTVAAVAAGFQQNGLSGALDALGARFPVLQGPLDAFKATIATLADAGQRVANAFGTGGLAGVWETLQNGALTCNPILRSISDVIATMTPVVQIAIGVWDLIAAKMRELGSQVGPALVQLWTNMQPGLQQIIPILQNVATIIGTVVAPVLGVVLAGAISLVMGLFQGIVQALPNLGTAFSGVFELIGGVLNVFVGIVQAIWAIISGIFTGDWPAALDGLKNAWQTFADGTVLIVQGLWDTVSGIWMTVFGFISGLVQGFIDTVIGLFQTLSDVLVGHSIIPDMMAAIQLVIDTVLGTIKGIWEGALNWLKDTASTIWNGITTLVGEKIGEAKATIDTVSAAISTAWGLFWDAVSGKASEIWTSISTTVATKIAEAKTTIDTVAATITTAWGTFWAGIGTTLSTAWETIVNTVTAKIGEIQTFLTGFPSQITQTVLGIGSSIIDGIRQGIENAWAGFTSWLTGLLSGLPDPVKQALGIHSPSRVFAEQIGAPIIQGIQVGAEEQAPFLMPALNNILSGMLNSGKKLLQKGNTLGTALVDQIKQQLGIHSPSAVADATIGQPVAQGIIQGMQKGWDGVLSGSRQLITSLTVLFWNYLIDPDNPASIAYIWRDGWERIATWFRYTWSVKFLEILKITLTEIRLAIQNEAAGYSQAGGMLGQAIIDGLVAAIRGGAGAVTDAMAGLPSAAGGLPGGGGSTGTTTGGGASGPSGSAGGGGGRGALFFAEGGIVTSATSAVIGEAGPEAVIPLAGMMRLPVFASLQALAVGAINAVGALAGRQGGGLDAGALIGEIRSAGAAVRDAIYYQADEMNKTLFATAQMQIDAGGSRGGLTINGDVYVQTGARTEAEGRAAARGFIGELSTQLNGRSRQRSVPKT